MNPRGPSSLPLPLANRRSETFAAEAPREVDVYLRVHVEADGVSRTIELQKVPASAPEPVCFVWIEEAP